MELLPYDIEFIVTAVGAHLLAPFAPAVFAGSPLFAAITLLFLL